MTEPVKVKQLRLVTDAMQFTSPEDGIAIVRWVKGLKGQASLGWNDVIDGEFTDLHMLIGGMAATERTDLTRAEPGDWVIRDPYGNFRAIDELVFEITHEVVQPAPVRTFATDAVISAATGILICDDFADVQDVLSHVLGRDLWTHMLPAAHDEAYPHIIQQYPWIGELALKPGDIDLLKTAMIAINDEYGPTLTLTQRPKGQA